jgi:hypothetical protein
MLGIFGKAVAGALMLAMVPGGTGLLNAQEIPATGNLYRETVYGIGYTGNIPKVLTGAHAYVITPRLPAGLYIDVKIARGADPRDNPNFRPDGSFDQGIAAGHIIATRRDRWLSVNLALTRPIGQEFAAYVGGGISRGEEFRELLDPQAEIGNEYYWLELSDNTRPNLLAGLLFRGGRHLMFQIGAELYPPGANFGVSVIW